MASTEILSSARESSGGKTTIGVSGGIRTATYPLSLNDIDPSSGKHIHSSSLVFHITRPMDGGNLTGKSLKARQDGFLKAPQTTGTLGMIQMYMPAITEAVNHDYGTSDTSVLNDLAESVMVAQQKGGDTLQKLQTGAGAFGERLLDRGVQAATSNQAIVMETGQIQKQRISLLYNGTGLRTQTFNFTLRPRSVSELKHVGEIIYMFRRFSAGTRGQFAPTQELAQDVAGSGYNTFGVVDAPPIWFVEERVNDTNQHRSIDKFMFGPAAVTSVKVNKTPDQLYQTIARTGGDPVEVELEISMQEMIPTYSDFWESVRGISYRG